VFFDINTSALKSGNLKFQHQHEIGLLVKSVDLPKFTLKTTTLNQYNRKKVVTLDHDFMPINIKFHDDRAHIINTLWQSYYSYYFADPSSSKTPGAYSRNAMKSASYIKKGSHVPKELAKQRVPIHQFMSYNRLAGYEPSRRDDVESVILLLVYFRRGKLPWTKLF
jgi:hypothetical protein